MIKKLTPIFAAALMAGAVSCSNDDMPAPVSDGNVIFEVSLNGQTGTRALGDGLSAKNLKYAVYDADTEDLVITGDASFGSSLSTKVALPLVNGNSYKVAFFAYYNMNSPYTFNLENKTVDIDYSVMNTGSSMKYDFDCFYKLEEIEVKGAATRTVVLQRPVAHINWGTNDKTYEAVKKVYGENPRVYGKMTVKAYKTLNLLTGEADNEEEIVSNTNYFSMTTDGFPVEGYEYIYTMPILVQTGEQLVDAKLEVGPSKSNLIHAINVASLPVERNYRTNIYGSLLTSSQEFVVEKEPNFDGDYNKEVWDGTVGQLPAEVDGVYTITNSGQLAAVARAVNAGNSFADKTVSLAADLDLGNFEWTPIGINNAQFSGTFDGNGNTIRNLKITKFNGKDPVGLFGKVNGHITNLVVENVDIDVVTGHKGYNVEGGAAAVAGSLFTGKADNVIVNNTTIKAHHYAGGIAGYGYANISGCEVNNIVIALTPNQVDATTWDYGDKAGAIIGFNGEGNMSFTNNKVSNATVSGYRHIGGIIGYVHRNNKVTGNVGTGIVVKATPSHTDSYDGGKQPNGFGLVYGFMDSSATVSDNNVSGEVYGVNAPVENVADLKAAVEQGGYISIPTSAGSSIVLNESLTITKPTIIDLSDGASIQVKGENYLENSSELTITGGVITGDNNVILNNNGATLIIDGATVVSNGTTNNNSAIYSEGDLIINSGSFTAKNGNALRINMANGNSGKVVVNGGEFVNSVNGGYAVSFYGDVDFEINGGVFSGVFGCGRADNGARGVIRGGTFICEGSYYGFAVDPDSSSKGTKVTIEGGDFFAEKASPLYARDNGSLTLKGGRYNKAITTGGSVVLGSGFKFNTIDTDITVNLNGANRTFKMTRQVVAE